ncbi:hypothetical protein KAI92_03360 [Candidatus Parcubacteria bacterium]|nr:hypothetical protein [Candidatus Parcubacteria bacterium]
MHNQTQNPNQNLNSEQNENQSSKKEPFSFVIVKMILVILMILAPIIIIVYVVYLINIPKTNNLVIPLVNEVQCEIDSDCELVYVGPNAWPLCDTSIDDYKCFNQDEAKNIKENRIKAIYKREPCLVEFDKYVCKCKDGKCEKVKEELIEEVAITTNKMKYEQREIVKITIENNSDREQKMDYPAYIIERFENNNWIEVKKVRCPCDADCNIEGPFSIKSRNKLKFEWDQQESWCDDSVSMIYSKKISKQVSAGIYRVKSIKRDIDGTNDDQLIYSNKFTIKGKSDKEVVIRTDKEEYKAGEIVKVTISNTANPIYTPFLTGANRTTTHFYQLKENTWKILTQYCETDCISTCENDVLNFTPCVLYSRPEYAYYKYNGPWEFQWNQKECIYKDSLCGEESYKEGLLKQVLDGEFKVEFCYFDEEDVNLTSMPGYAALDKRKCVESKFTIKEKSALNARCSEKVVFDSPCHMSKIIKGYEFNEALNKCKEIIVYGGCSFETPFETLEECQEVCEKTNCAKAGEFANPDNLKGKTNYPDNCCFGLKGLGAYGINNNGECEPLIGTPFFTCMPCGNGVCEEINNFKENRCNCPEDCN